MIWVARTLEAHPDDFRATMRSEFGVRLSDLGGSLSWSELAAYTRVAANDPSTRLGAAMQGWAYPATMAEIVQISTSLGKHADEFLPWGLAEKMRAVEAKRITDDDMAVARETLARVSAMRNLDGYDGG